MEGERNKVEEEEAAIVEGVVFARFGVMIIMMQVGVGL